MALVFAPLAQAGARLLAVYLDWADEQLRALGCPKRESRALAGEIVATLQGTMLVAHTLRSSDFLTQQLRRTERWLDDVLPPPRPRSRS